MRRWIGFAFAAVVLCGAAWYFGRPNAVPAPATPAVASVPAPAVALVEPPKVVDVINLARAYEPVREPEPVLPGGVDPASFIEDQPAPRRIPLAAVDEDEIEVKVVNGSGTYYERTGPAQQIDVMPWVVTDIQNWLLNFVPTPPGPGELVFVPMGVPYATGIAQPIPPNASIVNGLLNFTPAAPVEALKVMPREVK